MHYEKKDIDCTKYPFSILAIRLLLLPGRGKDGELEKSRYGSIPIAR
jgi:hypothetical protein